MSLHAKRIALFTAKPEKTPPSAPPPVPGRLSASSTKPGCTSNLSFAAKCQVLRQMFDDRQKTSNNSSDFGLSAKPSFTPKTQILSQDVTMGPAKSADAAVLGSAPLKTHTQRSCQSVAGRELKNGDLAQDFNNSSASTLQQTVSRLTLDAENEQNLLPIIAALSERLLSVNLTGGSKNNTPVATQSQSNISNYGSEINHQTTKFIRNLVENEVRERLQLQSTQTQQTSNTITRNHNDNIERKGGQEFSSKAQRDAKRNLIHSKSADGLEKKRKTSAQSSSSCSHSYESFSENSDRVRKFLRNKKSTPIKNKIDPIELSQKRRKRSSSPRSLSKSRTKATRKHFGNRREKSKTSESEATDDTNDTEIKVKKEEKPRLKSRRLQKLALSVSNTSSSNISDYSRAEKKICKNNRQLKSSTSRRPRDSRHEDLKNVTKTDGKAAKKHGNPAFSRRQNTEPSSRDSDASIESDFMEGPSQLTNRLKNGQYVLSRFLSKANHEKKDDYGVWQSKNNSTSSILAKQKDKKQSGMSAGSYEKSEWRPNLENKNFDIEKFRDRATEKEKTECNERRFESTIFARHMTRRYGQSQLGGAHALNFYNRQKRECGSKINTEIDAGGKTEQHSARNFEQAQIGASSDGAVAKQAILCLERCAIHAMDSGSATVGTLLGHRHILAQDKQKLRACGAIRYNETDCDGDTEDLLVSKRIPASQARMRKRYTQAANKRRFSRSSECDSEAFSTDFESEEKFDFGTFGIDDGGGLESRRAPKYTKHLVRATGARAQGTDIYARAQAPYRRSKYRSPVSESKQRNIENIAFYRDAHGSQMSLDRRNYRERTSSIGKAGGIGCSKSKSHLQISPAPSLHRMQSSNHSFQNAVSSSRSRSVSGLEHIAEKLEKVVGQVNRNSQLQSELYEAIAIESTLKAEIESLNSSLKNSLTQSAQRNQDALNGGTGA